MYRLTQDNNSEQLVYKANHTHILWCNIYPIWKPTRINRNILFLIETLNELPTDKFKLSIIGDGIIKDVQACKIKNMLETNDKINAMSFSGATVDDMQSYIIPL